MIKNGVLHKNRNLTEGPIIQSLVLFALPLLGSSLIQQLYNTVDLIFVGQILGKEASAAVGASSLLVTCMIGFFTGMSIGSGIVAGRFFGAGDHALLKKTIHTAMAISFAGGLGLMLVGYFLAPIFLQWLNTPSDILMQATGYIRIYFFSMISIVSYNFGSGILRALGNSKAPMLYQFIGGLSNIVANAIFIWVLGWGVKGAAFATFFSQSIAAVLVLRHLAKLDSAYRLHLRWIRIDKDILKKTLSIGIPSGIQAMVITLSNLFVQFNINSLGVDNIAAFTAYFKVELFIYLPIMAVGQAITTFTSQNSGAKKTARVHEGLKAGVLLGVGMTALLILVVLALSSQAFGLFLVDAKVIAIGQGLASITFPFYFMYAILEVFACALRGLGKAMAPMVIILLNLCVLRTGLLYVMMQLSPSVSSVAIVYPITWATTAFCLMGSYLKTYKRSSLLYDTIEQ